MTAFIIDLPRMIDLAIGTPETGAINLNILHSLLHILVNHINLNAYKVELVANEKNNYETLLSNFDMNTPFSIVEYQFDNNVSNRIMLDRNNKENANKIACIEDKVETGGKIVNVTDLSKQPISLVTPDDLEKIQLKINTISDVLIEAMPENKEILEYTKSDMGKNPLKDMFNMLNLTKRLDAVELTMVKITELINNLTKEYLKIEKTVLPFMQLEEIDNLKDTVDSMKHKLRSKAGSDLSEDEDDENSKSEDDDEAKDSVKSRGKEKASVKESKRAKSGKVSSKKKEGMKNKDGSGGKSSAREKEGSDGEDDSGAEDGKGSVGKSSSDGKSGKGRKGGKAAKKGKVTTAHPSKTDDSSDEDDNSDVISKKKDKKKKKQSADSDDEDEEPTTQKKGKKSREKRDVDADTKSKKSKKGSSNVSPSQSIVSDRSDRFSDDDSLSRSSKNSRDSRTVRGSARYLATIDEDSSKKQTQLPDVPTMNQLRIQNSQTASLYSFKHNFNQELDLLKVEMSKLKEYISENLNSSKTELDKKRVSASKGSMHTINESLENSKMLLSNAAIGNKLESIDLRFSQFMEDLDELKHSIYGIEKEIKNDSTKEILEEVGAYMKEFDQLKMEFAKYASNTKNSIGKHKDLLEQIQENVLKLNDIKIDKDVFDELMEQKADYSLVQRKVSFNQFAETKEEISNSLLEIINSINEQELSFQEAIDKIYKILEEKLNISDFEKFSQTANEQLTKLRSGLNKIINTKVDTEAAAAKFKVRDLKCLSCDTDVVMVGDQECIPRKPDMPRRTSVAPEIAFELSNIKNDMMEGKRVKSFSRVEPAPPTGVHRKNRHCGGSHTSVTQSDIVHKTTFQRCWTAPEPIGKAGENTVKGTDGRFYRGNAECKENVS